jgi:hypothetical protein
MFKKLLPIVAALLLAATVQPAQAQTTTGRFGRILLNSACTLRTGTGSPESAVTGNVCDLYLRTNGGTGTTLYIKETGTGNTGWVAVSAGTSGAPTTATYITQTADGTLSAEQALGSLATGLMNSTTTTGVVSTLAPTDDNVVVGSGAAWQLKALTDCDAATSAVTYDTTTNVFGCNTISGGGANALLDGSSHTDTLAGTVVRGDIIVGNSTPKWARFAKCSTDFFIKYTSTDPSCFDLFGTANTFTATQQVNNVANGFLLHSQFASSPGGFLKWEDSGSVCYIKIFSGGTSPNGSLEINQGNPTGCATLTMRWRAGSGNIEHTPISEVATANANVYTYWMKPLFTEAASGTHALIAGLRIDTPTVTNGSATTTETATLYIQGASAQGTNNYALHVAAGDTKLDGNVITTSVRGTAVAFASVPGTPVEGMLVAVTDSSTSTWGATITGGGANHVLAYYNGTNWTVAGK